MMLQLVCAVVLLLAYGSMPSEGLVLQPVGVSDTVPADIPSAAMQSSAVLDMAWNPTHGSALLALTTGATVTVWNVSDSSSTVIRSSVTPDGAASSWADFSGSLAWFPGGDALLIGNMDGSVSLWDRTSGGPVDDAPSALRTFKDADQTQPVDMWYGNEIPFMNPVAISSDGSKVVSASDQIRFWDVTSGEILSSKAFPAGTTSRSGNGCGTHLSFSETNSLICSSVWLKEGTTSQQTVWMSDPAAEPVTMMPAASSAETSVDHFASADWSPVSPTLLARADTALQVWNTTSAEIVFYQSAAGSGAYDEDSPTFTSPGFTAVAWSPTSDALLATGGGDQTVRVWNITDGHSDVVGWHNIWASEAYIRSLLWSPDGSSLLSTSSDGSTRVWNLTSGEAWVLTFSETGVAPESLPRFAWSPDGKWLAGAASAQGEGQEGSSGSNGRHKLHIWELSSPEADAEQTVASFAVEGDALLGTAACDGTGGSSRCLGGTLRITPKDIDGNTVYNCNPEAGCGDFVFSLVSGTGVGATDPDRIQLELWQNGTYFLSYFVSQAGGYSMTLKAKVGQMTVTILRSMPITISPGAVHLGESSISPYSQEDSNGASVTTGVFLGTKDFFGNSMPAPVLRSEDGAAVEATCSEAFAAEAVHVMGPCPGDPSPVQRSTARISLTPVTPTDGELNGCLLMAGEPLSLPGIYAITVIVQDPQYQKVMRSAVFTTVNITVPGPDGLVVCETPAPTTPTPEIPTPAPTTAAPQPTPRPTPQQEQDDDDDKDDGKEEDDDSSASTPVRASGHSLLATSALLVMLTAVMIQ